LFQWPGPTTATTDFSASEHGGYGIQPAQLAGLSDKSAKVSKNSHFPEFISEQSMKAIKLFVEWTRTVIYGNTHTSGFYLTACSRTVAHKNGFMIMH